MPSVTTEVAEVVAVSKRGRKPIYTGRVYRHIVKLLKTHTNACLVMRILRATNRQPEYALRNTNIVPTPLAISQPTLQKFAKREGVTLPKGRPVLA